MKYKDHKAVLSLIEAVSNQADDYIEKYCRLD